jgi:hypothetical protein
VKPPLEIDGPQQINKFAIAMSRASIGNADRNAVVQAARNFRTGREPVALAKRRSVLTLGI